MDGTTEKKTKYGIVWEYESNENAFKSCVKSLVEKGVDEKDAIELLERVYHIAMSEFVA